MKKTIKKSMLCAAFVLLAFLNSKAFTFDNQLNCAVTINFEMWDNSVTCGVCKFSTITIPANTSVVVSDCSPLQYGICINILDIGGFSPASNHYTDALSCHPVISFGQSGTTSCSNSATWTATVLGTVWTIS
jgi:hypothetical protein